MILTKKQRERLRQSVDAGCAILSVQDCLGALETMDDLERQLDEARKQLEEKRYERKPNQD